MTKQKETKQKAPVIIFWDLETLANLKEVMAVLPGLGAYPGLTLKASINSIISFGYKRLGDKKASIINAWDFPKRWNKDVNDDFEVVKGAYDILKNADGIVTHNGKKFDLKFLNSRLVHHGLPPLHKIPHIDTRSVASAKLFVFNNRLNTIAEFLGCETKMENGGWSLWERVLVRDKKACKTMSEYCKQDVQVLEQVYLKLLPLMNGVPNYNLFTNGQFNVCPNCGSSKLHKHGIKRTRTRRLQRYLCNDCGTTSSTDQKDKFPTIL